MSADDQRAIRILVADPGIPDLEPVRERFREHVERQWLGRLPESEHARAVLWTLVSGLFGLAELASRDEVDRDTAMTIATHLARALPRRWSMTPQLQPTEGGYQWRPGRPTSNSRRV